MRALGAGSCAVADLYGRFLPFGGERRVRHIVEHIARLPLAPTGKDQPCSRRSDRGRLGQRVILTVHLVPRFFGFRNGDTAVVSFEPDRHPPFRRDVDRFVVDSDPVSGIGAEIPAVCVCHLPVGKFIKNSGRREDIAGGQFGIGVFVSDVFDQIALARARGEHDVDAVYPTGDDRRVVP